MCGHGQLCPAASRKAKNMKRFAALTLALTLLLLCACGTNATLTDEAKALCGSWAYIHDDETAVLVLKANGNAVFHGAKYTYNCDKAHVTLTASDGTQLAMRYSLDGDKLYLYEHTTYTFSGDGSPDGIVGTWTETGNRSFEFKDDGSFIEDGCFVGSYSVNDTDGSIKLVYEDEFEDTTLYYHTDGAKLTIEYPWPMVPQK